MSETETGGADPSQNIAVSYTFDSRGNRQTMTKNGITTHYAYDANNRLLRTRTDHADHSEIMDFHYDPNGNTLSQVPSTRSRVRPGSEAAAAQTAEAEPELTLYTYDVRNRQVRVEKGSMVAEYTYLPNGMRRSKTVNGVETRHLWDHGCTQTPKNGGVVSAVIVADITDGVVTTYIRGLGNELIAAVTGGVRTYFLHNARGDVIALTDDAGNVIRNYHYSAFGVEIDADPNDTNPFRFGGMYWDSHTQTYMTPNRHFSPRLGRWTQPDPHWGIHNMIFGDNPRIMNDFADQWGRNFATTVPCSWAILQAGNLYVFVMNNPVFFVDPTGLLAFPGQIHNLVVNHVAATHGFHREQRIDFGRFSWGRADLISPTGQVWDVKRDRPRQIAGGVTQVQRYTTGTWRNNPNQSLSVGGEIAGGQFITVIGFNTYHVTFRYAGNGVIAYDFTRTTDWQAVGDAALGVLFFACAAVIIVGTKGAAAPVLVPALT